MKTFLLKTLFLVCFVLSFTISCSKEKQEAPEIDNPILSSSVDFLSKTISSSNITLPYREGKIMGNTDTTKVIIYLHGGSSKGNDNITQMSEPAIEIISNYLQNKSINAIVLVPQCPTNLSWGAQMNSVLKALIDSYVDNIDKVKIYALGGSMGGTGAGSLVSTYPQIFSGAMLVAWNPAMSKVASMVNVPFYTVMGSADNIMDSKKVLDFVSLVQTAGGNAIMDVEEGWTHSDICEKSYTNNRLDWIFIGK